MGPLGHIISLMGYSFLGPVHFAQDDFIIIHMNNSVEILRHELVPIFPVSFQPKKALGQILHAKYDQLLQDLVFKFP